MVSTTITAPVAEAGERTVGDEGGYGDLYAYEYGAGHGGMTVTATTGATISPSAATAGEATPRPLIDANGVSIPVSTAREWVATKGGGHGFDFGKYHGMERQHLVTVTASTGDVATIRPPAATAGEATARPLIDANGVSIPVDTATTAVATEWGGYGRGYGKDHGVERYNGVTVTTVNNVLVQPTSVGVGVSVEAPPVSSAITATVQPGSVMVRDRAIKPTAINSDRYVDIRPEAATAGGSARPVHVGVTVTVQPNSVGTGVSAQLTAVNPIHITIQPTAATAADSGVVPNVVVRTTVDIQPGAVASGVTPTPIANVESIEPLGTMPAAIKGVTTTARTSAYISPNSDLDIDFPDPDPEPANHRYRRVTGTGRDSFTQSDPPERLSTEPASVYVPKRQVLINGDEVTVDRDIRVAATEYGYAIAECTLWNLDPDFWSNITRGDTLEIRLGWESSGAETVFQGNIGVKRRRHRNADRSYTVRGNAVGHHTLNSVVTMTFTDLPPHRMVERIIDETDLQRGYIATGSETVDGSYTLGSGKELGDWLDRIAHKATDMGESGERWLWYTERGKLYFHPEKEQVTTHIPFSSTESLLRATPTGFVGPDQSQQEYEVVLRNEPVIRRGVTTSIHGIDSVSPDRLFHISSYTHDSSTTTGRHHTTATFSPMFKTLDEL